jgi:hypothetical protein
MIPITFHSSTASYGIQNNVRPLVIFEPIIVTGDEDEDDDDVGKNNVSSSVAISDIGGTVIIVARSSGGWVFDLNLTGEGECSTSVLEVIGGTYQYIKGFSGDECRVAFSITHDGVSSEIQVTYNTRPD